MYIFQTTRDVAKNWLQGANFTSWPTDDDTIHHINIYASGSSIAFTILICWIVIYLVDSAYPMFEQLGPEKEVNMPAQISLENEIKVIFKVKLSKNASSVRRK